MVVRCVFSKPRSSLSVSSFDSDGGRHPRPGYDDELPPRYDPEWRGRQPLPADTPMYNKLVRKKDEPGLVHPLMREMQLWRQKHCMRNIKRSLPAIGDRLYVGEVFRCGIGTLVYNLDDSCTNTWRSAINIDKDAHNQGRAVHRSGKTWILPLPGHARIVYLDVRGIRWCLFDSGALRSFVWPRNGRMAKGISRTLRINHCQWNDIFAVRGRCVGTRKRCASSNRTSEGFL